MRSVLRQSVCLLLLSLAAATGLRVRAQLLGLPPLPPKVKKAARHTDSLEWMWQYGPPPAEGREHELIQDPAFRPFLEQHFTAPQSFWGLQRDRVQDAQRLSLPDTIETFLAVPGVVIADGNRYMTATGAVRHFPASRGLLFADLDSPHPLTAFAAIDWTRDGRTTAETAAEYTLWIFTNQPPGPATNPTGLPPPLVRSLTRWMATPLAGSGIVQHINAAILVDPDGTPHQIPVPTASAL